MKSDFKRRRFQESDLSFLIDLMTNHEVMKNTGFKKVQNLDQIKNKLNEWMHPEDSKLGIWAVEMDDGNLFSWCMLKKNDEASLELGYMTLPQFWSRGLTSKLVGDLLFYAHEELKYPRVIARVNKGNAASIRVLQKNNMKQFASCGDEALLFYESVSINS